MSGHKKGARQVAVRREALTEGGGWRDPWLWVCLLAVIPLLVHMRGAPLGVPVADDFDYLHRVALSGVHTLLDGCGSIFYWRPLSRQVYFETFWPLILGSPAIVAWFHVAALALTSVILYRAFRTGWPAPLAATAATFPLFAESTRMLVTWPSNFQDLGAMLFAALALHEAARGRLITTLISLLLSLLSKEVGVLAALLIPWMPHRGRIETGMRLRIRWAAWSAGVVAFWGLMYVGVSRLAGLVLPSQLETDPAAIAAPLHERFLWAMWNSARSAFSLPAIDVPGETLLVWVPLAVLLFVAVVLVSVSRSARERLRSMSGWPLWGVAWFAAAAATLVAIFPTWAAYRGIFATIGLGIALTAVLGGVHRWLLAGLVAIRVVALFVSPAAPTGISGTALETGAAIDFPNLVRIQRLMVETRDLLEGEFPQLSGGAVVVQRNLPRMSEWAFVDDKALQSWYRDTTLRWTRFDEFRADTSLAVATIVEYQPHRPLQLALVEPDAMRLLLAAEKPILTGDWSTALDQLRRAEALQRDPGAAVFLGSVVGKQATALAGLGQVARARTEAERALKLWPDNPDSRYILAYLLEQGGYYSAAAAQLDTLLRVYPDDPDALRVRARLENLLKGGRP